MSAREIKEAARQLTIQTGVCKRLVCDLKEYRSESKEEKTRIDALAESTAAEEEKAVGSEGEYRLKQARAAHAETLAMIEDSRRRLEEALAALEKMLEGAKAEALAEQVAAAEKIVAAAHEALAATD